MPLYRDDAIVLRTQKLGEADRIVTFLTREHGKVRGVGKGVRRTSSKFGARLEPFMAVDVQLHTGRSPRPGMGLDTVTQVETIGAYARSISEDYGLYTSGTVMLEAADRLVAAEHEPAVQQYWLLAGGLRALSERHHDAGLVLDSYLLRALAVAGWAPSFEDCARCGEPGPHHSFNVAQGGAVCPRCRPPGSTAPAPETFALLSSLLAGDWAIADASDARHRKEASGIVAAYGQYYLERTLRSLKMVER